MVGEALGGESPRLRINKFQTITEKDEQKGVFHLINGVYLALRNPRSHENIQDTQQTADAIIYFINFLIDILGSSKAAFTVETFMERVFDPYFVEDKTYAELLVSEIPATKLVDTLIEIYRKKLDGEGRKLKYIFNAILDRLTENQIDLFMLVVSDELRLTQNETVILLNLQLLPPHLWNKINEVAKLRIENKLIEIIKSGEVNSNGFLTQGALGTWAREFVEYFLSREKLARVLIHKLEDKHSDDRRYIREYFLYQLGDVITSSIMVHRAITAIANDIRNMNSVFRETLTPYPWTLPEAWCDLLVDEMKDDIDEEGNPLMSRTKPDFGLSDIPF